MKKLTNIKRVIYSVSSGPNKSHLWDIEHFEKLERALEHSDNLPLTPMGETRPFIIHRIEFKCKRGLSTESTIKEVKCNFRQISKEVK